MTNYIAEGETVNVTAPSGGLTSGQLYLVGTKVVIPYTTGVENDVIACATGGVFEVAKASGAISLGQQLFYDATAGNITTTALGNTFAGFAYEAELTGATTVKLCLSENNSALTTVQVAQVTTADGSDAATTQALANALKVKVNALLTALKNAGIVAKD